MKRLLFIPVFTLLCLNASGQTLQTKKKTVLFHHAEDWCSSCGEWGWALKDSMINIEQAEKNFTAYNASIHFSSHQAALKSPIAEDLSNNSIPQITAIPSVTVDNIDVDVFNDFDWSADPDSTADLIRPGIDSLRKHILSKTSAVASVATGFYRSYVNDSVIIKAKARFQKPVNGEFRIAAYVLEDSIYASQTTYGSPFMGYHRQVLYDAVQHGAWGQLLATGTIAAGTEMTKTFRMKLQPTWNKKRLSYLVIVYKKNTGTNKYEIENATKEFSPEPSSVSDLAAAGIQVFPNPASGCIYLNLPDASQSEIRLISSVGQVIATDIEKQDATGIKINLPADIASGIYYVCISYSGNTYLTPVRIKGQ